MNIAMMTNNYKPFVGGVPISIERLSDSLRGLGHNVFIFAPAYNGDYQDTPDVVRYKSFNLKMGIFLIPNSFDRKINNTFAKLRIDVIHTHHPVFIGNTARHLSRRHNLPLLFTWHTQYEKYLHHIKTWARLEQKAKEDGASFMGQAVGSVLTFLREKIVLNWVKQYASSCDCVFAPSDSMKALVAAHGVKTPIQTLSTGLPDYYYDIDPDEVAAIRELYKGDKKYLFCTVSRLSTEKNLAFIFESLVNLKSRIGDCFNYIIIGEGAQREMMEKAIAESELADNVKFLGSMPNSALKAYYAAADLFLFSSKTETQGIVLLEAMAGRTPIVALDANGVCDVVRNGVNGFLTDENPERFAGAVIRLLSNSGLYKKACNNAWHTAERYSSHIMAKQAEKAYFRALEARSKETIHEAVKPVYNVPKID